MSAADLTRDPRARAFLGATVPLLVGGRETEAAAGATFETLDPAIGRPVARVARAGMPDVDAAVAAARTSFDDGRWRDTPPSSRAAVLLAFAELVREHGEALAQLDTLDNGMPLRDARAAVDRAVEHFRYFAGWATKIHGETLPHSLPGRYLSYTRREPVGVVAAVIAWNTPIDNAVWKLAAPLAVGCSVILKPAEQTPLSAVYLGRLLMEAGVPPGVLSVLGGFGEVGAALATHPEVDKIAFTGSTGVGREIVRASAGNLKRVSLELGGKSPAVVYPDADLEQAAQGVLQGIFHNAGQICCASSRALVHREARGPFLEALVERARSLRVGPGSDPTSEMGPVVSEQQLDRVLGYVREGRAEGAALLTGGDRLEGELRDGYFLAPTVFADVDPGMRIAQEEIFGPVLAVSEFADEDQLRTLANRTIYGLAASVWTTDVGRALRAVDAIRAGTVWVNTHNTLDAGIPFGGFKQSGYGRELGRDVLEGYLETKSVWIAYGEEGPR